MEDVDSNRPSKVNCRAVILVVDDDPFLQKLACKQLERLKYQAIVAGGGYEALQYLEKHLAFDLILMDCHMPGMDGFSVTEQIRTMEDYREIPIIAMTASVIEGLEVFTNAGMNDYLGKPFALHELSAMLEKWLFSTEAKRPRQNAPASPSQRSSRGTEFLDLKKLEQTFGKEGSLEIIRTFFQCNSTILEEMQKARSELKPDRVKSLSHKLKGSSSMACLRELPQTSAQLEAAGARAEWQEIDRLIAKLGSQLKKANEELNTALSG